MRQPIATRAHHHTRWVGRVRGGDKRLVQHGHCATAGPLEGNDIVRSPLTPGGSWSVRSLRSAGDLGVEPLIGLKDLVGISEMLATCWASRACHFESYPNRKCVRDRFGVCASDEKAGQTSSIDSRLLLPFVPLLFNGCCWFGRAVGHLLAHVIALPTQSIFRGSVDATLL